MEIAFSLRSKTPAGRMGNNTSGPHWQTSSSAVEVEERRRIAFLLLGRSGDGGPVGRLLSPSKRFRFCANCFTASIDFQQNIGG